MTFHQLVCLLVLLVRLRRTSWGLHGNQEYALWMGPSSGKVSICSAFCNASTSFTACARGQSRCSISTYLVCCSTTVTSAVNRQSSSVEIVNGDSSSHLYSETRCIQYRSTCRVAGPLAQSPAPSARLARVDLKAHHVLDINGLRGRRLDESCRQLPYNGPDSSYLCHRLPT